ncbi:hypothetical protein P43SY_001206 [Pythium insidiosum]|uniref:Clu domain-containing protein n=1 Tax=Pythium insidiosum TaxID=114742 RepID=A0AAD5LPE8_PYTIN|nr:hypothetical protein P43SY_001206 [Pythium insidiosum]
MGAVISRELEQDDALGVNGVVAETQPSRVASLYRRAASDVAQHDDVFQFCKDWDLQRLTDLLRWHERIAAQDDRGATFDLRALHRQLDALETELSSWRAVLADVERELDELPDEQSDLLALQRATLENRRDELIRDIAARQLDVDARRVHLLATLDGVDLDRTVRWRHYLAAMARVQFHARLNEHHESDTARHPAAMGYAMSRDPAAAEALEELSRRVLLLPPPERHEIDGHTDDSASSSAASEDGDAEAEADDDQDEEPDEKESGDRMAGDVPLEGAASAPKDDEDEDGEEEDEEDPKPQAPVKPPAEAVDTPAAADSSEAPSLLTPAALVQHEKSVADPKAAFLAQLKRPRVIERPVPVLFDATLRSPVFFGYSLAKQPDELVETTTHDHAVVSKENAIFEQKLQQQRTRLETTLKSERGKLESVEQRQAEMLAKRERYWEKRQVEYERAKKELDPSDIFFRTRDVQDKKTRETHAFEDEEVRRMKANIATRMEAAQREFDEYEAKVRFVRSTDQPLGDQRLRFHEEEADRYQSDMVNAKKQLQVAKEEYVALKSTKVFGIGNQEAKHRAQLLFAEDQIRSKERELESVCVMYENELFLLKRAQEAFEREQLYLPFFQTMQPRGDPSASFTALELAMGILVGLPNSKVPLEHKIRFVFDLYSRQASVPRQTGSVSPPQSTIRGAAIRVIRRDAFAEILRLVLMLLERLGDIHPRRQVTREYLVGIADREFLALEPSAVIDSSDPSSPLNGMTAVEFSEFCTHAIESSKYLSAVLGVPWRFEAVGRFVLQHMSATQQYRLGLINSNDLKYIVARQSVAVRAELSRWKKDVIHERALAMGENDPLKTDYSKYLPRRRAKLLSKVVPLDHGGYRNLLHFRMEVILRATVKLQTSWRARRGRQQARLVAEKQAFYHARGVALREAREKVEQEWRDKDDKPAHTVEKMKFEAKIRMKQVKLRTKGHALSREQVFALLMEEAVQQAQREVENRFREMEEELGYLAHDEALRKPHDDVEYLKPEISKALVAQVESAKQEAPDVASVMDAIALKEEIARKKRLQKQQQTTGQASGQPESNNMEDKAPEVRRASATDTAERHLVSPDDQARRLARTTERQDMMVFGRFPPSLYTSGMTRGETLRSNELAFPDPPLDELRWRLQKVCVGMTDFKLNELLQELPSKRHICAYATTFRCFDGSYDLERMEQDLFDHFRMVRGARELAEALASMADTDLEIGLARRALLVLQKENESVLDELVQTASHRIATTNAEATIKKLVRMGFKDVTIESLSTPNPLRLQDDGEDDARPATAVVTANPAAVLHQKEQHELSERRRRVAEAHTRFLDALRSWRDSEMALRETQALQLRVAPSYPLLPTHRTQWSERLHHALRLPERDAQQLRAKYTEVLNVCQDFVDTATAVAAVLVRERHLPLGSKSILPLRSSPVDGRHDEDVRGGVIARPKFEAHGIVFSFCTDDHGRCEQSDEYAAKVGGLEVRNAALFLRALSAVEQVLVPLECVVDCLGYRVLCVAKQPIELVTWNDAGTAVQKVVKQLVLGSDNRGKTVTFQSKELDTLLGQHVASRLNLARHGVRGFHDLTAKMLHTPADLLGYTTPDKRFALLRFARAMPPEDPEVTPHLVASTRGMSILWRQLRPELVASFPTPLSSDALSCMTYSTPDWQTQALGVEAATQHLVDVVIPAFAAKLSRKPHYFTAPTFRLTLEMHRHGIGMRHLGLLRAQFPYSLSGTATLQYATAEIQTSEDFTREIERGAPLVVQGRACRVSRNRKHRFDAHCVTLSEVHQGDSVQGVVVWAGRPECQRHAAAIRDRLLAEMVARTLKNLLRHWLRMAQRVTATGLTTLLHRRVLLYGLNLLTGSEPGSEAFWATQLVEGIRVRFGPRAVSEVDQQNLRRRLLPHLRLVVTRVAEMMAFRLRPASLLRLQQHPDCYLFVVDDLANDDDDALPSPGCRVKHNLAVLHFSMASLLLLHATVTQATSYKQLVVSDAPSGYWPLCERRGLSSAVNLGTMGSALTGRYLPGCLLEAEGPIVNTDLNRAIELHKEKRSYVAFPLDLALYPVEPTIHVTLEAWCRCDGHESTRRVVLTIGRFALSALKANVWAFSVNVRNIDILASGARVELGKWTHLVGTFDGTMLRLFVDGWLQQEVDVENVVDLELARREAVIAKTRQDILDLEEDAKGKCFRDVRDEMQQRVFLTKDGKKQIKALSQKLLDEHEFRVRLSRNASAAVQKDDRAEENDEKPSDAGRAKDATPAQPSKRDLSKVSRADFEPLAKKQLIREAYERRVQGVLVEFEEMRRRVNAKIETELEEQTNQDSRELRIGSLSTARRRDGKYFFHGRVAHVAYYRGQALSRDQVNAHFVLGVRDRAHVSDDLFALAATRFSRTLELAPDDPQTLERLADNICKSLKYDLEHRHARELYKKKVRCGLAPLRTTENVHGIAEVLKNLPREPAFRDLFVHCFRALVALQPDYFAPDESPACRLSLRELARLPFAFFLGSSAARSLVNVARERVRGPLVRDPPPPPAAENQHTTPEKEDEPAEDFNARSLDDDDDDDDNPDTDIAIFADIIRRVVQVFPTLYGDQLTSLAWLRDVQDVRAVVLLVLRLESGEDVRALDLSDVPTLPDADVATIAQHNRFLLSVSLARCALVTDASLQRLAVSCSDLEVLDVTHCELLTDATLRAVGSQCRRLRSLRVAHCHSVTDLGVDAVVRGCGRLEELVLSFCERVSERSMAAIGASCPQLTALELEMCVQLGSPALRLLVTALATPTRLRRLNLAGCHRVSDDGLLAVAKRCTRLQNVNLRGLDKLTDASVRVLTHNCLELETLDLEDVCLATGAVFVFDQEGDGRGVVDKMLLKQLKEITLTGCSGLDDQALGHLAHRAKILQTLTLSTCSGITDRGLAWLLRDMLDKSPSGEHLTRLDVSYCEQLSARALHDVATSCPHLVALNLSGCVHLRDQDVTDLVTACPLLVSLQLAFCRELTDAVLVTIAQRLSLEEFNVSRCIKISDDGMREIAGQFASLRKLNVSACKKLSALTLSALWEHCVLLEELDAAHCPLFPADLLARFVRRRVKVTCAGIDERAVHNAGRVLTQQELRRRQRREREAREEEDPLVGEGEDSKSSADGKTRSQSSDRQATGSKGRHDPSTPKTTLPPLHRSRSQGEA